MRRRVKAFVVSLALVLTVAAAAQAATFRSEERPAPTTELIAAGSRQRHAAPLADEAKSSDRGRSKVLDGPLAFTAKNERYFTVSTGILMTGGALARARKLAEYYEGMTGRKLHFTSGYRTPERQATAMYEMVNGRGVRYYGRIYRRRRRPAEQILAAYLKNSSNRERAIHAMTLVIKSQIRNGVFISNHLRERAFDIRLSARRGPLNVAVAKLGGRAAFELNHYHVEL